MRILWVILGLAAIAVGQVHLHRREAVLLHELQRAQSRHAALQREIWDRHVEIGRLLTPREVRHRSAVMSLDMTYGEPHLSQTTPRVPKKSRKPIE